MEEKSFTILARIVKAHVLCKKLIIYKGLIIKTFIVYGQIFFQDPETSPRTDSVLAHSLVNT